MFTDLIQKNKNFLIFFLIGLLSALFELSFYTFLFSIIKFDPVLSSPIAQIASFIFNFSFNNSITFKESNSKISSKFLKYFILWMFNIGFTTLAMYFLVQNLPIYPTILRFIVLIIMFLLNYFISKKYIFK